MYCFFYNVISHSVLRDVTSSKQLSKTSIVQMRYVDFIPRFICSAPRGVWERADSQDEQDSCEGREFRQVGHHSTMWRLSRARTPRALPGCKGRLSWTEI